MSGRGERTKMPFRKAFVAADDDTATDKAPKAQKLKLEGPKSPSSAPAAMQKKAAKKSAAKKSLAKKFIAKKPVAKLSKTSISESQLVSSESDDEDDENEKNEENEENERVIDAIKMTQASLDREDRRIVAAEKKYKRSFRISNIDDSNDDAKTKKNIDISDSQSSTSRRRVAKIEIETETTSQ